MKEILTKLPVAIKMLILDVDGVMTNGNIMILPNGEEVKVFNTQDGHGIKMLQEAGIDVAIITGRDSSACAFRAKQLKIKYYFAGIADKLEAFRQLLQQSNLSARQCAYMGDDLPDLPVLKQVGLSIAPLNAHAKVLGEVDYVTRHAGGEGAVREVCDCLIEVFNSELLDKAYMA
ncbi:MAG: HAD-IIIA family hydrolase [Neisseriaceae bacterium]|nr:HAD-IIIA family hydrolase [Neisseriaceae bacterium]